MRESEPKYGFLKYYGIAMLRSFEWLVVVIVGFLGGAWLARKTGFGGLWLPVVLGMIFFVLGGYRLYRAFEPIMNPEKRKNKIDGER